METNRLPLSLHEAAIKWHYTREGGETVPDGVIDDMVDAAQLARESGERALVSHGKIMQNPMRTQLANQRESRENAFKNFAIASKKIDIARDKAERAIEHIEQTTKSPGEPKDAAAAFQREAIRNALANMTQEARSKVISAAIADDDADVLIAAFTGPVLLTGLGVAEREALRHDWRRKKFPREVDKLGRLRAALRDLDRVQGALLAFVDRMTDGAAIKEAEAAEKAALASKVA